MLVKAQAMSLDHDEWLEIIRQGAAAIGLDLSPFQLGCFYRHMVEMRNWNRRINLTAITNPREIAVKHFLDSIVPSGLVPEKARIVDIGSGAGFPGLPLKVLRPLSHVTLIDSARKRINFLRHVLRQIDLDQVEAIQVRIEELAQNDKARSGFDVIVSRAFTNAAALTRTVMPWLKNGGTLLLWKGPDIESERRDLEMLPEALDKDLIIEIHPYCLPLTGTARNLIAVKMA